MGIDDGRFKDYIRVSRHETRCSKCPHPIRSGEAFIWRYYYPTEREKAKLVRIHKECPKTGTTVRGGQMVSHRLHNPEIAGSTPAPATNLNKGG